MNEFCKLDTQMIHPWKNFIELTKNEYLKLLTQDGGHNRETRCDQSSTVCIKGKV